MAPTPDTPRTSPTRSLLVAGAVVVCAVALLLSLGFWQLRRLEWKEAIIARIETRVNAPPQPLPPPETWSTIQPDDYEYRRVTVRGTFEHDKEAYVFHAAGSQTREPGWLVLTPLRLPSGAHVIVNRGFVPMALRDPALRDAGQVTGETQVTGLMRAPEARNPFTPDDQPDSRVWHVRDPASIASYFDLQRAAPFSIDADDAPNPGGWPKGGETTLSIPNNHLSYAMTWFGLAATLIGVFAVFAWRRMRGLPDA